MKGISFGFVYYLNRALVGQLNILTSPNIPNIKSRHNQDIWTKFLDRLTTQVPRVLKFAYIS